MDYFTTLSWGLNLQCGLATCFAAGCCAFWSLIGINSHKSTTTSLITIHPLNMLIMRFPSVLFCSSFFICISLSVWEVCVVIRRKWTWLEAVCAADSDWNSAEALGRSQASCLSINPRHTLQLWPHWASIAAVIQLPGRETRTASQADNNRPRLENSGLFALVSAVYLSVSFGRASCSWWPLGGLFPGSKLYLESIFFCCCYRKQFWD